MKRLITYQQYPIITDILICDSNFRVDVCDIITAAINTRDFAKTMVKVRSSNIWGYNIDIKDNNADTGDVYVQFKGEDGGPDDIYVYYDVPVRIYRKWHTSPSKGHFFWQYIRGKYKYSKLTGDKKTKQAGGVTTKPK